MKSFNFTLSPAYATRGAASVPAEVAPESMPAWTLFSAVMLASTIFTVIWYG
jgi:hypothetical protein